MLKVLPGLFVGNYRDSKDVAQLERHFITHILSVHDSPKRLLPVNMQKTNNSFVKDAIFEVALISILFFSRINTICV
jgi:hypothetical protein